MRRDFDLPESDREELDASGRSWETVRCNNQQWLFVHEFGVPPGYQVSVVTTALLVEPGYPESQIDMAYFCPALVLNSGRAIGGLSNLDLDGKSFQRVVKASNGGEPVAAGRRLRGDSFGTGDGMAATRTSGLISVSVRMTGTQYAQVKRHLFPGDGLEAVALLLAGRHCGEGRHILVVNQVIEIPYDDCIERDEDLVRWRTDRVLENLPLVMRKDWAVIKVHSHPSGFAKFSTLDDTADCELFGSIFGWTDSRYPYASMVMLPNGRLFGRWLGPDGEMEFLEHVLVVGDDIRVWRVENGDGELPASARRNEQTFGRGTTNLLHTLRVGVVGCSGTGSPVVEQLARLQVGKLVLVDPKFVEEHNLNRILNATMEDARQRRPKVEVLKRAVDAMGLGTAVLALPTTAENPRAVRALADCDVLFGCMDGVTGRQFLNRLATFYVQPYFDVGVRLVADGKGGISHVCGSVHFVRPDGSSLRGRQVFTDDQARAEWLHRFDPAHYQQLRDEGYIAGVQEERPAVIPVNMLYASLAVNEFLARLHPYRLDGNDNFALVRLSLEQMALYTQADKGVAEELTGYVGRGDVRPLLDLPMLSEA